MLRKVLSILILSTPLLSFGSRPSVNEATKAWISAQTTNAKARRGLFNLDVSLVLGLKDSAGYIEDANASTRLFPLYWIHSHRDKTGTPKLAELKENHTTFVPIALNNIIEKVVNHGWEKTISVTDEEVKEWREKNPKVASNYVYQVNLDERALIDIGDRRFYIALKIYERAQEDLKKVELALQAKAAEEAELESKDAETLFQAKNDQLASLLGDYHFSENKLIETSREQRYMPREKVDRAPASTREHVGEHKSPVNLFRSSQKNQ